MGGGLGHLTRARAFLHTTGLDGDRGGLRALLGRTIAELGVRRLVVDALPAGILGELADFSPPGLEIWHVARLLKWERYTADASVRLPRFDRTLVVEELHEDHRRALDVFSDEVHELELADPRSAAPEPIEPPYVLVVHVGPDEETVDLVGYAREVAAVEGSTARIVLTAPTRPATLPDEVAWLDVFPATGLFARAERIVTAAGFNAVRQTDPFRSKRFLVPYPRRFDDQFTRAARARIPEHRGIAGGGPA